MKSLKQLLINILSINPKKHKIYILPFELRRKINKKYLELNDYYIENSSYAIFDLIDYTWFLHHGWLKDGWEVINKNELGYHNDCKRFFQYIDLSENEKYYFYPSLNTNYIIIKESKDDILINRTFPSKSSLDNNPYISDEKNTACGINIYKDGFKLFKNPYI